MIRYFLLYGDSTANAYIVDKNFPNSTSLGQPLATLGMQTYCTECNTYGTIVGVGDRPAGRASNGQQWALSGDYNKCLCGVQPFHVIPRVLRTNINGSPADCRYLDRALWRVQAPADFYKHRNAVSRAAPDWVFHNFSNSVGGRRALKYDTSVNGLNFPVYLDPGQATDFPINPDFVFKALEAIPFEQLRNLDALVINPAPYAGNAANSMRYGRSLYTEGLASTVAAWNFDTGSTVGRVTQSMKTIDIFPTNRLMSQVDIDSLLLHETGHIWHFSLEPDQFVEYLENVAIDKNEAPSEYGRQSGYEDFAESAGQYWASRGTPCEAQARSINRKRFEFFDKIASDPKWRSPRSDGTYPKYVSLKYQNT